MFDVRGCMLVLGQLRYRQHTTTSTAVVLSLNALLRWIERRTKGLAWLEWGLVSPQHPHALTLLLRLPHRGSALSCTHTVWPRPGPRLGGIPRSLRGESPGEAVIL